jgi:hypothetical protein
LEGGFDGLVWFPVFSEPQPQQELGFLKKKCFEKEKDYKGS